MRDNIRFPPGLFPFVVMAEIIYLVMFCTEDCSDTSVITWHVSCNVGAGDEYLVDEDSGIIVACTNWRRSFS